MITQIKRYVATKIRVIRYFNRITSTNRKQNRRALILQESHRLEKAMMVKSPLPMRSISRAQKLLTYLIDEYQAGNGDLFCLKTGYSVLTQYIKWRTNLEYREEKALLHQMKKDISSFCSLDDEICGGIINLKKENVFFDNENVNKLFLTRHSIREFSDEPVKLEDIKQAIKLANTCPSACNRQCYKVYILDKSDREKMGYISDNGADKWLYVTADISAYNVDETLDWIVSGSIFAGYMSLALHAKRIGNCLIRMDLIRESAYDCAIRDWFQIPNNEQFIIEIPIGYYKEEFSVPYSNRKSVDDVIKYKKEEND